MAKESARKVRHGPYPEVILPAILGFGVLRGAPRRSSIGATPGTP